MTITHNRFLVTACLAIFGLSMKTAVADEWNKEIIFQFSAPVQVPGKVLQAGKYVFRLADNVADRDIVEIFSVDEKGRQDFVTTILTVPDFRVKTPDKPIIRFEERHAGDPEAIKSWFYPGDNFGWQFVYPKSEALQIASVTPAPSEPALAPVPEPVAEEPAAETAEESPILVAEKETLISEVELTPEPLADDQPFADQLLPETAGHSAGFLLAGMVMIGAGLLALSSSLRKGQA